MSTKEGRGRLQPRRQGKPRKFDPRARRTRARLGTALIELMAKKPLDQVKVQEVLDRAAVGRSTFYLHFSDKYDLFLSQLEMFCGVMSTMLSANQEKSHRVVPVEEMFAHVGDQKGFYRDLGAAGRLVDFFELAQGYFARGIEQRLHESGRLKKLSKREVTARSAALAGSLLSLLQWWMDHDAKDSPRAMDELFHRMVWSGLQ
jgi:AcrR family transcriptional regulator